MADNITDVGSLTEDDHAAIGSQVEQLLHMYLKDRPFRWVLIIEQKLGEKPTATGLFNVEHIGCSVMANQEIPQEQVLDTLQRALKQVANIKGTKLPPPRSN